MRNNDRVSEGRVSSLDGRRIDDEYGMYSAEEEEMAPMQPVEDEDSHTGEAESKATDAVKRTRMTRLMGSYTKGRPLR